MRIKHYFIALAFMLAPTLVSAQTSGVTYTDDASYNGQHLTFTVTQTTNGLQNLVNGIQNPLNGVLTNVIGILDGVPLLNALPLSSILSFLTGIGGPQTLNLDLGTIYTATINGPNGLPLNGPSGSFTPTAWSGPLTIPATVYDATDFSEDNLLKLALSNSGLEVGALSRLLDLGLSDDINLGLLKSLLNINLLGGSDNTPGIPVVAISNNAFYDNGNNVGNKNITSLDMSGATNLTTIGYDAFQDASNLAGDLIVPSGVSSIGSDCFGEDTKLRSITFKCKTLDVASMGSYLHQQAFYGCDGLEYIDLSACGFGPIPDGFNLSRNYLESPFDEVSTHTVVYLPKGVPDSVMPAAAADVNSPKNTENVNYVRLDKTGAAQCALFNLEYDKDYFIPYEFTAGTATIKPGRVYQAAPQANTLYLPFDTKLASTGPAYTLGYYDQHGASANDNTFVFTPLPPDETLKANTPYIVVGPISLSLPDHPNGLTIPASPVGIGHDGTPDPVAGSLGNTVSDDNGNSWKFCGTTESTATMAAYLDAPWDYKSTWGSLTTYNLGAENTWGWATSGIGSMRAFIVQTEGVPGAALGKISLGEPTGITGIGVDEPTNSVETRVYSVNGQYLGKDVNALPKGLYIVNGKKVVRN